MNHHQHPYHHHHHHRRQQVSIIRSTIQHVPYYIWLILWILTFLLSYSTMTLYNMKINNNHTSIHHQQQYDYNIFPILTKFLQQQEEQEQNDNHVATYSSINATVMAMATYYDVPVYERFIGSLRATGYDGHIIIGVEPNPKQNVLQYLQEQNVTVHILKWVPCTYSMNKNKNDNNNQQDKKPEEIATCVDPYPDIKIRWSRFPLMRDWLTQCTTCTGPVLVSDARDVIFQRNPFSNEYIHQIHGLQVFEEHQNMTTQNWLTEWPIRECKNVTYHAPMLCSGTTIGTRTAMIDYLNTMYNEMTVWINDSKCHFQINGDDQSIHNYIYYSGQLPNATAMYNRQIGSIVNTVGYPAGQLFIQYSKPKIVKDKNGTIIPELSQDTQQPYPGANDISWIGIEMNITNQYGLFVDEDGITVSPVIHQYDRLGPKYLEWFMKQSWNGIHKQ